MDFDNDVNIDSLIVITVPLLCRIFMVGEAVYMWVQGIFKKFTCLPLNFAVNLKLM